MNFARGFKQDCELIVAEFRQELELSIDQPIDMNLLASHLLIPVHSLDTYLQAAQVPRTDAQVQEIYSSVSAFTFAMGKRRVVVYNEQHGPARHRSNLAHELAHAVMHHPFSDAAISVQQQKLHEKEAAWMGGVLMLSRSQAHHIAGTQLSHTAVLERFALSAEMLRFRLNVTGAARAHSLNSRLVIS